MSYDEEEMDRGFKLNDDDTDEPIELEDEVGSFKFDEETDDDPDNRYH